MHGEGRYYAPLPVQLAVKRISANGLLYNDRLGATPTGINYFLDQVTVTGNHVLQDYTEAS
jgi:hypothetical protein